MDKFMDSPWFLRLTALSLSLILFFSVRADDQTSRSTAGDVFDLIQDVPVEVYYDTENLVVTGVPETVNMTIEGPANIVQTTKLLKDFSLKLDLQNLTLGEHTVRIQPENLSDKLDVRLDPATVTVNIEEKITQTFRVDPELNTRLLAEGYEVKKMEVQPSTIQVTGAKSVVESISFVKVSVTGEENINKSFEQQARVRVLDRDLNKLSVALDPEEVTVKVEVEEFHKDVPIVLQQKGKTQKGVEIEELSAGEEIVSLYGSRQVLESIDSLPVDVDISKVMKSETLEVNLKKPEGISKLSFNKMKVKVTVKGSAEKEQEQEEETETALKQPVEEEPAFNEPVKREITKEFSGVPIGIRGLDPKFKTTVVEPAGRSVSIRLTADHEVMNGLKSSDVQVFADASAIQAEGRSTVPLVVEAPEHVSWSLLAVKEVTLQVERAEA